MQKIVAHILLSTILPIAANAQDVRLARYELKHPPVIGEYHGVAVHVGGISGMAYVHGSPNEFYLITDRGPNADAENANNGTETKVFPFPKYAPKILKVRGEGDSLRILETVDLKLADGVSLSGIPHPARDGEINEVAWSDTNKTPVALDDWGIDSESLSIGNKGDFWIGDEYGPSIWRVEQKSGALIKRYVPFGRAANEIAIDSILAKRKPNGGFEAIACTPNGKVYALLQSPMYNPDKTAGGSTRLHRMLEIDPATNATRMFAYEHEPPVNAIRNRDWSIGDMAAINDHEFLVIEHASRNGENVRKIFKIDLSEATPITREDFNGKTFEQLENAEGCMANGIMPVKKTFYFDLLANGWDAKFNKPEGLTVVNDRTIAVIADNDFGVDAPNLDGILIGTGKKTVLHLFTLPESMALNVTNAYQRQGGGN